MDPRPHRLGSPLPWELLSPGSRSQWQTGRMWSFQTLRGGRRCSGRWHHLGFRYFFWDGSLPASPTSPAGCRGPVRTGDHVITRRAALGGRTAGWSLCLPASFLRLPWPMFEGAGGEADAAGASQPVTRLIHQAAASEGTLKKLDPTLITCQPERPNAAQKLWNKRAISYYF